MYIANQMRDHSKSVSTRFIIITLLENRQEKYNKAVWQDSTEPTRSDIIISDGSFLFENVRGNRYKIKLNRSELNLKGILLGAWKQQLCRDTRWLVYQL